MHCVKCVISPHFEWCSSLPHCSHFPHTLFLLSYRAHFEADPSLAHDAALIREHVDLLERQRPIEVSFTWPVFPLFSGLLLFFFSVKHHYLLPSFLSLQECLLWLSVPKSWFHSFNRLSKDRERKMDNLCSVWPSKPALKKWLKWVMYISIVWWTCHGAVWLMGLGMALVCLKINYFAWAIYLKALVCS